MKSSEQIAIIYHSLFNYVLSKDELVRWEAGKRLSLSPSKKKNATFKTSRKIVRNDLEAINKNKMRIAKEAADTLSKIPSILFIGVTGSLSMNNAKDESDIDFMVITIANTLWLTRISSLLLLMIAGFKIRRALNKDEKNKICLNLWLDERSFDLPTMPRNAYTAHEVAQVIPLYNKTDTYMRWIKKNEWITDYWPNAVSPSPKKLKESYKNASGVWVILNAFFYLLQRTYMNGKITKEKVTNHYAYFHPFDWGGKVMSELSRKGVFEKV